MMPPGPGVRLPVLLRLQTGEDLLSGDRMLADANAAGVVDCVRQGSRYSADRRLTEALGPVEPAWLQAVNEDLRLACGHIHDRRYPVGEVPDGVMPRSGDFPVPRNWIGCHLKALNQRSVHIRLPDKRVHDETDIVAVDRTQETPVPCPCIDFHFDESAADGHVSFLSVTRAAAAALLDDGSLVGGGQSREGDSLLGIFGR